MKLLNIIIAVILLSSCNVKKNLNKTSENKEENSVTTTATTRTITEEFTSPIKIIQDTLVAESENIELFPIFKETDKFVLKVSKDKSGKVTASVIDKGRTILAPMKRVIIENEDKKEKKEIVINNTTKEVKKEVTGGFNFNYLWWLFLLLLIPIWKYRKYFI